MGTVPISEEELAKEGCPLTGRWPRSRPGKIDRRLDELDARDPDAASTKAVELIEPGENHLEVPSARPDAARAAQRLGGRSTLAAVLQAAPEAVFIFDAGAVIHDCSPAAEQLLGLPRERIIDANFVELLFAERLRFAIRGVIDARGTGRSGPVPQAIVVGMLNGEGAEVPVELTLSWAPETALFAAHLHDNREQGERERELAAEARRRTRLLDLGQLALGPSSPGLLIDQALSAVTEEVKLSGCEVWGYDAESAELHLRGSTDRDRTPVGGVRPPPGSRLARALSERDGSVLTGERLLPSSWLTPEDRAGGAPSDIAAILLGADGVLGALIGAGGAEQSFSNADMTFVASIAQTLASSLERDRVNNSLTEAENRLRTLVERLPAITYRAELGADGRWLYVSPQVEEVLGLSAEECVADGVWWKKRVHPDDIDRVIAEEKRAAADRTPLDIEYRMTARGGRQIWIRDRASVGTRGEDGRIVVDGMMSDVTVRRNAEDRLRHLAEHDHLTELLNRRGFERTVDHQLQQMPPGAGGALAVVDVDHLKLINDSRGHAAGDALLREIAAALKVSLRAEDVIARLSGDEFGIFIPDTNEGEARRRLGELVHLIRLGRDGGLSVTASAGVVFVEGGNDLDATDLLVHADAAMYQAKEQGRDRIVFSDAKEDERLSWLAEIREAVEERRLALFAQPIYDLETGELYASELLVRMIDREGQAISAKQFIPTAERFGLISGVDHWVLARAVEVAAAGMRVTVNLSAASIADEDLTKMVADRLEATGADPSRLIFEITETVATPTIELLKKFAGRVDALGCGLALDDVGTGFGTLTYLQNLSFSHLKIDMSFVQRMLESKNDLAIVRSLVTIARELELVTVAEGVESEEVLEELKRLGVKYAQGYFLGEPARINTELTH